MRKRFHVLLLLLAISSHTLHAQLTNKFVWTTKLPSKPLAIAADGPRGAYVLLAGNTLMQIDAQGRERWKQTYADWPAMERIATGPNGQLVAAGSFHGEFTLADSTYRLEEAYQRSTFLVAFDSTHTRRWTTYVIAPDGLMSRPNSLAIDNAGGVVAFGAKANGDNPFLCRFDADGRFVGSRVWGGGTIPAPDAVAMSTNSQGIPVVSIDERTKTSSSGVLALINDDSLYWRTSLSDKLSDTPTRRYATRPVDMALDRRDNAVVLANYTLTDNTLGLNVEHGQALLRYDASGTYSWQKTGVVREDSAMATGLVADPSGAFVVFGGYEGMYTPETNQYSPADYISLAGYSPDGNQRWSTRLNAPNGNDELIDVVRANNGSLLLLGSTTGTLSALSMAGTSETPAYFLTNLQPFELKPTTTEAAVVLCAGSQTTLRGQYAGYFEQPVALQLSDASGSFGQAKTVGNVPIGVPGNLFSANDLAVTIPLADNIPTGTSYKLRAVSLLPDYLGEALSVTVAKAPAIPQVAQVGDELVVNSTATPDVTYQWYGAGQQPVAGATGTRFRPTQQGAYYAVAVSNGCQSLASEALSFLLLASEPTIEILVYPNPTTDRLLVEWPAAIATNGQIELTDLSGRTVRQQARTGDVTELSVRNLTTGTYLLNLQADGQPRQVRKVMVK